MTDYAYSTSEESDVGATLSETLYLNYGTRPWGVPFFVIGDLLRFGVEKTPVHCTLYPLYDPSNKFREESTVVRIDNLIFRIHSISPGPPLKSLQSF